MSKYENMEYYINHELHPALNWSATPAGMKFCSEHPNFEAFMTSDPNEDSERCYIIYRKANGIMIALYIGECKRLGRLYVHAWHFATDPKTYFGLDADEIDDISIEFDNMILSSPEERKAREIELRIKLKPVLNPAHLGDRCIPRSDRYNTVHNYYNDPVKLAERIEFITDKGACLYNSNAFIRPKTPCCNYSNVQNTPEIEDRINNYIISLTKENRASLFHRIATSLGEGFFVRKAIAVRYLARILETDPFEMKDFLISCLKTQIEIREKLIFNLSKVE